MSQGRIRTEYLAEAVKVGARLRQELGLKGEALADAIVDIYHGLCQPEGLQDGERSCKIEGDELVCKFKAKEKEVKEDAASNVSAAEHVAGRNAPNLAAGTGEEVAAIRSVSGG